MFPVMNAENTFPSARKLDGVDGSGRNGQGAEQQVANPEFWTGSAAQAPFTN